MTIVKGFVEDTTEKLVEAINNYANKEQVKIVQISYSYAVGKMYDSRALVLFSKGEQHENSC